MLAFLGIDTFGEFIVACCFGAFCLTALCVLGFVLGNACGILVHRRETHHHYHGSVRVKGEQKTTDK